MRIKLKELVESLQNHYQPKNCVWCGKKFSVRVTGHTTYEMEGHNGIYRDEPQEWYPHYDIEYFCGVCDYFEHYTHDVDGTILGMRINKVFLILRKTSSQLLKETQLPLQESYLKMRNLVPKSSRNILRKFSR